MRQKSLCSDVVSDRDLAEAIQRNRRMVSYRESCRRIRHRILIRMFDYADQGKIDKAIRVVNGLSDRIAGMSQGRRFAEDATDRRVKRERVAAGR